MRGDTCAACSKAPGFAGFRRAPAVFRVPRRKNAGIRRTSAGNGRDTAPPVCRVSRFRSVYLVRVLRCAEEKLDGASCRPCKEGAAQQPSWCLLVLALTALARSMKQEEPFLALTPQLTLLELKRPFCMCAGAHGQHDVCLLTMTCCMGAGGQGSLVQLTTTETCVLDVCRGTWSAIRFSHAVNGLVMPCSHLRPLSHFLLRSLSHFLLRS